MMLMFTELIFEGLWSVTVSGKNVCWNWPARISINLQGLCSLDCGPLKDLHSLFLFLSLFTLCLHFSWRIYNVFHFTFVTTCNLFHIKRIHNSLVRYIIIIRCVCVDSVVNHGYRVIILYTLQLFSFPESIYLTNHLIMPMKIWSELRSQSEYVFSTAVQWNLINWMRSFINNLKN